MIHHLSVAVGDPMHVSNVMAEILQGQSVPFLGHPGSYVTMAFDAHGTMIEFLPLGTALVPGAAANDAAQRLSNLVEPQAHTANHIAISVPVSIDRLQAIAAREGWRLVHCQNDHFDVIEFWIENRLLIELLPPEIVNKYLTFMAPESLQSAVKMAVTRS
jgi:hypothetical protein